MATHKLVTNYGKGIDRITERLKLEHGFNGCFSSEKYTGHKIDRKGQIIIFIQNKPNTEKKRQAAAKAYRSGSPDYQEKEKEWYKTLAETEENPTVKAAYEKLSKR